MSEVSIVLSAEHAGRRIPPRWAHLFTSEAARSALDGHRGWDPGSDELSAGLSTRLRAPLVVHRVSRLLVECNRSLDHPALWSEFTRGLRAPEKSEILDRWWHPHRVGVRNAIASCPPGLVVHVGVHTFTPVWKGRPRATDIGILYDPTRPLEAPLAESWTAAIRRDPRASGLTVHRNRPYRGWTDGLTTALRRELPPERYVGFELELSQRRIPASSTLLDALAETLTSVLEEPDARDR